MIITHSCEWTVLYVDLAENDDSADEGSKEVFADFSYNLHSFLKSFMSLQMLLFYSALLHFSSQERKLKHFSTFYISVTHKLSLRLRCIVLIVFTSLFL